jgi:hypothetical protein
MLASDEFEASLSDTIDGLGPSRISGLKPTERVANPLHALPRHRYSARPAAAKASSLLP